MFVRYCCLITFIEWSHFFSKHFNRDVILNLSQNKRALFVVRNKLSKKWKIQKGFVSQIERALLVLRLEVLRENKQEWTIVCESDDEVTP